MAGHLGSNVHHDVEEASIISTRGLEAFSRKVTTTASHLMGDPTSTVSYTTAMTEVHKSLRRPGLQRNVFSMARTTPTDMVRSKLSKSEIQHRALAYVPKEMLETIPDDENTYSLFQGFQATTGFTEESKKHRRKVSRGRKLLEDGSQENKYISPDDPQALQKLKREKASMVHEFEMLAIRKNMASSEIKEIDNKIANLSGMRKMILDRLSSLEQEEAVLEHDIVEVEERLDEAQELIDEAAQLAAMKPTPEEEALALDHEDSIDQPSDFMSQSIYERIPSAASTPAKPKKPRITRKRSMAIRHEHFEPGTAVREIKAHQDSITALDFDAPFGTLVTSAMDDSVKVWDLNAGRCMGILEGHTASVRALQVEDNILVTGSVDATIRLWDLSKAQYDPYGHDGKNDDDGIAFENPDDSHFEPPEGSMDDCALTVLRSHMDEITALHFKGDVLVSGSADKTIRHWDLEKGRCVQTLDVMWAAAQAASTSLAGASIGQGSTGDSWRQTSRQPVNNADFVGALQVFDAALACGTADGMVRLWDLRSGQVHRSLVGHTGPVTALQFDDSRLVTGSQDRSIRIWDLRTGSIYDAYAYDNPVTSMMFDNRRIVSAAGEDVVKVYDKLEARQWDCGAGVIAAEEGGGRTPAVVERVRIQDGYMVEGRRDGTVGAWTC